MLKFNAILIPAVLACFAMNVGQVEAQSRGSYVVENPTSATIFYQIKWGNGPWKQFALAPNKEMAHSYRLNAAGRAPVPQLRYDWITGDGRVTNKVYRMNFYAVTNVFRGKRYYFRYSSSGRLLYLYGRP